MSKQCMTLDLALKIGNAVIDTCRYNTLILLIMIIIIIMNNTYYRKNKFAPLAVVVMDK